MSSFGTIRARPLALVAVAAYVLLSWYNSELLANCVVSFAGSLALLALQPATAALTLNPFAAEYWIAIAVWCCAPIVLVRSLTAPRPVRSGVLPHAARFVLFGFIFIAFTAPIIAPLPPLAQGVSLQTSRSLPPFTLGIRWQSVEPAPSPASGAGGLESAVHAADQYLLHRTISFSRVSEAGMSWRDQRPSGGAAQSSLMFLFGTDGVGRDILSRVVYGTRYSLGIGVLVVFISLTIGAIAGMASGYAGGFVDVAVMRFVDMMLSIPALFLALTLMAILGQSLPAMVIVLSLTGWMGTARILRGEVMTLRHREFISASRLLGTSPARILRLHIFPNILPAIKNAGILQLGTVILAEASMSFLGLGIQAPEPSWGNMIADSMNYAGATPFQALFPGLALSALIISVHIVGDHSS